MAKISKHFGLTLPGVEDYSSLRVDVTFTDIDTDDDVDAQLKACAEVASKIDSYAEEVLVEQAKNLSGVSVVGFGLPATVEKLVEAYKKLRDEIKRQKEALELITK